MNEPLTPAQAAAAYYQQQLAAQQAATQAPPVAPAPAPLPPPPPPVDNRGYLARGLDYLSSLNQRAGNAVIGAVTHPIETNNRIGQAVLDANNRAGNAVLNYGAPPPPAPPPGPAARLTTAPAASPDGVTAAQPQADPLAPLMRPGGAGAAHAVGYSPSDKNMLGSLNEQGQIEQTEAAKTANAVQSIADTFKGQNDALAAQSQEGLGRYQQEVQDNATRRQQLNTDAQNSQERIQGKIADLEAQGIDPNKYFHDQSTGQRLLGALAVGLGTFGAHALGPNGHDSVNTALDIMNGAISREVDAQKTNLQKSLSVLSTRMNLNGQNFDQQRAMLEAERDSIQRAYTIASNETAKRAAAFKDNADVQTKAASIVAGLNGAAREKIGAINGQIYGIQKAGERVVGGNGAAFDPKRVAKETEDYIRDEANRGNPISVADARAHVMDVDYGLKAGGATNATAKPGTGANKPLSPRLARRMAELDAQDQNAEELDKILDKGTSASPSDRARASALGETLRNAGHKSIPENPLEFFSSTTARRAGLGEVRKDIQREKSALQQYGSGAGGGGASAGDGQPDIEGVKEEGEE